MEQNKKINIYVKSWDCFEYRCSTTWAKTCKQAKARFLEMNPAIKPEQVKAYFA